MVSSFGSEAVVLLHMLSEIDPGTPVVFLNTGKLFGETLRYRDKLQDAVGPDRYPLDPSASRRTRRRSIPMAICGASSRRVLPFP